MTSFWRNVSLWLPQKLSYAQLLLQPVTKCCKKWHFRFKWIMEIQNNCFHYNDIIMITMASQITSLTIVYSSVYSSADQRKHQSSVSLAFVRGIHQSSANSPHKGPVTRKKFPFDDVIMVIHSLHIQAQPTSHLIQLSLGDVTVILWPLCGESPVTDEFPAQLASNAENMSIL